MKPMTLDDVPKRLIDMDELIHRFCDSCEYNCEGKDAACDSCLFAEVEREMYAMDYYELKLPKNKGEH